MIELEKPDYIQRDSKGRVWRVFCKVCGYIICEQRKRTFWRSNIYSEMKIEWADGSAHVTNLCRNCIPLVRRDPEALMAIYQADIDDLCIDDPINDMWRYGKSSPRVTTTDHHARGIR